nr:Chain B, EP300-interacting inhibitor of differentiation 1 [Homo sapiens]
LTEELGCDEIIDRE